MFCSEEEARGIALFMITDLFDKNKHLLEGDDFEKVYNILRRLDRQRRKQEHE